MRWRCLSFFSLGRHRPDGYCRRSVHPERRSRSYSLRISAISLNFGGMMHTVPWVRLLYGYARPIFVCSTELSTEFFHDRLFEQVLGMTLTIYLFKDFSYWPEIWRGDAQYLETYCYLKWLYSANFACSTELWNFPWIPFLPGMRDDATDLTL